MPSLTWPPFRPGARRPGPPRPEADAGVGPAAPQAPPQSTYGPIRQYNDLIDCWALWLTGCVSPLDWLCQ
jgi:hypothetical protein